MTHRIEKRIVLKAPLARVWSALSDPKAFGSWFGAKLEGEFVEGATTRGTITIPKYEHMVLELQIERIQPQTYFAYRWHPYAVDPKVDYSGEPMTLVEFRLEPAPEGTLLRVTESGFEGIPEARRAEAFRMNDGGWGAQLENIARYVAK